MLLSFFGVGSGFTEDHTNAWFRHGEDVVFIDMSMYHVRKAVEIAREAKNCYMLITHMHDDHVSGLTLFMQYMYYTMGGKKLNIVIPYELYHDILDEMRMKDILPGMYDITILTSIHNATIIPGNISPSTEKWGCDNKHIMEWFVTAVPTVHTPGLTGKCFGYGLNVSGKKVLYSGDTCNLSDFISLWGDYDEFYVDCSLHYGGVHLKWENCAGILKSSLGTEVYLMHMDDAEGFARQDLGNVKLAYATGCQE